MVKGCYHLGEMTAAMIRLYCSVCHRFAQFKRTTLLDRFGPDKVMPSMLRDLKPCNVGGGTSRATLHIHLTPPITSRDLVGVNCQTPNCGSELALLA